MIQKKYVMIVLKNVYLKRALLQTKTKRGKDDKRKQSRPSPEKKEANSGHKETVCVNKYDDYDERVLLVPNDLIV